MADIKQRKCGCLYYKHGPPLLCAKHLKKIREKEEKGLRKLATQQAEDHGHEPRRWEEYESQPGKWVSHCVVCGLIAIVYDDPPPVGDQVAGRMLTQNCNREKKSWVSGPTLV